MIKTIHSIAFLNSTSNFMVTSIRIMAHGKKKRYPFHHQYSLYRSYSSTIFETENIKLVKAHSNDSASFAHHDNTNDKKINNNAKKEERMKLHGNHVGGIFTLELSTPSNLNAMTESMGEDIQTVCTQILQNEKSLRALIITGKGRAFSAGGDLKFLKDRIRTSPEKNVNVMRKFYSRFLSIRQVPVPTIAAINGHAVGAGLCFALACDLRLVNENAKLGLNFSRIGIPPGMGGSYFLPKLIGDQAAAKMIYTGDLIDAQEAIQLGLALKMEKSPEDLAREAFQLAERIASASPMAVRAAVRTLRSRMDVELDMALQREADSQAVSYTALDLPEGLNAKQEKREPFYQDID